MWVDFPFFCETAEQQSKLNFNPRSSGACWLPSRRRRDIKTETGHLFLSFVRPSRMGNSKRKKCKCANGGSLSPDSEVVPKEGVIPDGGSVLNLSSSLSHFSNKVGSRPQIDAVRFLYRVLGKKRGERRPSLSQNVKNLSRS